jgi:hypothetical protein
LFLRVERRCPPLQSATISPAALAPFSSVFAEHVLNDGNLCERDNALIILITFNLRVCSWEWERILGNIKICKQCQRILGGLQPS